MDTSVRENNLYVNGRIIDLGSGESELVRDVIAYQANQDDEYYTVKQDDEITRIAYEKYKDFVPDASKYWWAIADANNIENPMDLSDLVSQEILIPNIFSIKLLIQ